MDIHHLRIFASVYKNRSFSRASVELALTQPTVSDHIKTLEAELGCSLFDRLGRTIAPTTEAETLYIHAIEILEKTDAVHGVIGQLKKSPTGEIVLGASTIPGTYLLPHAMAAFRKIHPHITFNVIIADSRMIFQQLMSHDLLLGITGTLIENDHLVYIPFAEDELIAVAAPSLQCRGSVTLRELAELPFVMREEGSGTRSEIDRLLLPHGLSVETLKTVSIMGSTDALKEAVKAGLGITIISRLAVRDELALKSLAEIKIKELRMKRNFYIVTHNRRSLPAAYTQFVKVLAGTDNFSKKN